MTKVLDRDRLDRLMDAELTCVDARNPRSRPLMSPATVAADVDAHTAVFEDAVAALFA